jgi:chromate reductase, NAD(P)H dehydrogenase (quinone)
MMYVKTLRTRVIHEFQPATGARENRTLLHCDTTVHSCQLMPASFDPISCLAVSGSLRQASSNTFLLEAAVALAPSGMTVRMYRSLGELPHFNPDLDPMQLAVVRSWIQEVRSAQGLLVSTPEYAHGLPGSLKNGLDWLVGSDAFVNKPFMLLSASSRSTHAHESLVEILSTMSGVHIKAATTTIPLLGRTPEEWKTIIQQNHADQIRASLQLFERSIRAQI